jgi:squalene-hopene/tetraprenyl-beta-curcumene cyclase
MKDKRKQFKLTRKRQELFTKMDTFLEAGENNILRNTIEAESAVFPSRPKDESLLISEPTDLISLISEAIKKTQSYYINEQHQDGYWWYELESNVTITSEYLMLLYFLGIRDEKKYRKIVHHILKNQRLDGTWSLYWGGQGDLSTTVEAYFALKLAGLPADDPRLRKAKEFILEQGGVEASRVFTKIYLALFGEYDWKAIPSIPPGLIFFPTWFPINIYNFSSWARSTIVPLSMIVDIKPFRPIPDNAKIRDLFKAPNKVSSIIPGRLPRHSWKRLFVLMDRLIKITEGLSIRPWRAIALKNIERWILEHQESSGDWGGIQPAMINSILALASLDYQLSDEAVRKGLEALERFIIEDEKELVLQSCISPIWDTALTALALIYSGIESDNPSIVKACRWLASKQIFQNGDWTMKRPDLKPGGWAFEFENNWYPDIDDTSVVLLLLNKYRNKEVIKSENLEAGLNWVIGMQGKDGGWGAFDVDNNLKILNYLPFGDLEAMIDPSTPDLTGRVLELLGSIGYKFSDRRVKRAIEFIKKTQETDGSWWGRWGVNYIYGTSTVLVGLESTEEDMTKPYIKKAVSWLKANQNPDGGWGESCESYRNSTLKCRGESTPSQTSWALLGLIAAGEVTSKEVMKGIKYLLGMQQTDGTWDEKCFTGTGFPKYFFIRYHNYRNCFPLIAFGKFISRFR